jgi:hypothetical protein
MCHEKPSKEKINKGGGWDANKSSKAFGISFADRPKAKTCMFWVLGELYLLSFFIYFTEN